MSVTPHVPPSAAVGTSASPSAPAPENPPPALEGAANAPAAVTVRSCLLGLALTALIALLTPYNDNIAHNTYLIGNHLPLLLIAVITLLSVVVNPILGRRRFRSSECVVAVGMMMISCAVPSSGLLRVFGSMLNDTVYFARDFTWYSPYLNSLPNWMLPSKDPSNSFVRAFYIGINPADQTMGQTWRVWLPIYAAWACFFVPLYAAVLFFCSFMRRQWVVRERLAFPQATIPLELLADPRPGQRLNALWKNRAFLIGAAIPFSIHMLNGLATINPGIPTITIHYNISGALSNYPWNMLDYSIKTNTLYFSIIGVTFFVPLEIAFSLWFSFLAYQFVTIFLASHGTPVTEEHKAYQGIGIVIAYGLMLLWIARGHFVDVFRNFRKPRSPDEFLSNRANVLGFGACFIMASAFVAVASGNPLHPGNWLLGFLVVGVVLFYAMVLTRLVIDAGILLVNYPGGAGPARLLGLLFSHNPAALTARQWTTATFTTSISLTDQRETLMPFAANATRLGAVTRPVGRPRYFVMLLFALGLSMLLSGWEHHVLTFTTGRQTFDDGYGPNAFPQITMQDIRGACDPLNAPAMINRPAHVLAGAAAVTAVGILRMLFVNFPLHPIGLLMSNSWAMGCIWWSLFVSWAAKWMILRWGGAPVYRQARRFFIGLVVGESVAGVIWIIYGLITPWPDIAHAYQVMPH